MSAIVLAETRAESGHYNIDSTTVRADVSAAEGKGGRYQRTHGRSRGGLYQTAICVGLVHTAVNPRAKRFLRLLAVDLMVEAEKQRAHLTKLLSVASGRRGLNPIARRDRCSVCRNAPKAHTV